MFATVGELRRALDGLPDDMGIAAVYNDEPYWITYVRRESDPNYPDWIELDLRPARGSK